MIRYLLDTNVISELTRPSPRGRVLSKLAEHDGEIAISSVTACELRFGVDLLPESRRRTELEAHLHAMLTRLNVLPYDRTAALWHGAERARLRLAGRERPFADGQIAAIAATRGLTVVTANVTDFEHFNSILVEDWSR